MLGLLWGDWVEPFATQTLGRLGKINPRAQRKYPQYPERSGNTHNTQSTAEIPIIPRAQRKYPHYPEHSGITHNPQSEAEIPTLPRAQRNYPERSGTTPGQKKSEPPDKGSSEELFGQTTVIGNLLLKLANVNKTILS